MVNIMQTYALVSNGLVINVILWDGVVYDEETQAGWVVPHGVEAVALPEGSNVSSGFSYDGEHFAPPVLPPAPSAPPPTAEQVLVERGARMAQATVEIAPLQDLVDMGEATEEDEDKLLEWKQYRAAVGKVQTQTGFPASVVWPDQPTI